MKNTFGNSLAITIFGESHGAYIGAVLDGLAPGIEISDEFINEQLRLRRPAGKISTARQEQDPYQIVSGAFEGKTTGTALTIIIPNSSQHSKDYSKTRPIARPGHADYTAFCKYHGYEDYRGGGHFSGRITAAVVAAGAIVIPALRKKGIYIGSHIKKLNGIEDRDFGEYMADISKLNGMDFAVLDEDAAVAMKKAAEAAAADGDSVGGVLETAIVGMPAGVGEPWFDSIESELAHAMFGIPAIKGIQFGAAFDMVDKCGSEYNDPFKMDGDTVITTTNNNGGINGGITNGMPITFRLAVKPTPSIYKPQQSVNFMEGKDSELQIEGRHDPAIIHRARVVVDSLAAIVMYDALAARFGTDYFCPSGE